MPIKRKLVVLRQNKPNINKVIGDVIDSLDLVVYEGVEVETVAKSFVRVIVNDLDEVLETELLSGVKRLRISDTSDPFYTELLNNGILTTDNSTLLNYVEVTNA